MNTAQRRRPAGPVASSRIRDMLRLVEQPGMLSLAGGLPAAQTLDVDRVRAAADRALDRVGPLGPLALQYGPTEGNEALRQLLADRYGVTTDHVLITTGSQQAIDLLARTECRPGDLAVVEAPSYLGALQSMHAAGACVLAVEGDRDGMAIDVLANELHRGRRPRLVYVVPNFANPTGSVLTVERRRALATLADRYGFVIVEDDPYGELSFDGAPPPSLAEHSSRVARLGSASKVLGPGLRVGWLVASPHLIERVSRLKQAADLHTPSLTQLIVAELLGDGVAQRWHLQHVRELYRQRADALHDALVARLGDRLDAPRPTGGMFCWARTTDGTDTDELFDRALTAGVAMVPGSAFSSEPDRFRTSMRLTFATLDPAGLERAVARLAAAW